MLLVFAEFVEDILLKFQIAVAGDALGDVDPAKRQGENGGEMASGFALRSLEIPLQAGSVPILKSSIKEEIRSCSHFASCCSW